MNKNLQYHSKKMDLAFHIQRSPLMHVFIILIFLTSAVGANGVSAQARPPQTSLNAVPALQTGSDIRSDALVLVNSSSTATDCNLFASTPMNCYKDFEHFIQPYLDHFGIPYTVLDIADPNLELSELSTPINEYAVIIIGHKHIENANGSRLDAITSAVRAGTGLVNFDNALSANGAARYQFIQDIFGFQYGGSTSGSGVAFPTGTPNYITQRHKPNETIGTGSMTLAGISLPGDVVAIATTNSQSFLAITTDGSGRAVQWGSYDWMSHNVKGPMYGLDDLVWRSIVWAARKPFVMQGLPPFVTMRMDDESGPFDWIHIANKFGIKPWVGLFLHNIDDTEAADLSALVQAGNATASIHAFDLYSFFYWNHDNRTNCLDNVMACRFLVGRDWHLAKNIPISKYVVAHWSELGSNTFDGLSSWGVESLGTMIEPNTSWFSGWIKNGPFRKYEEPATNWPPFPPRPPLYYADYVDDPENPEQPSQFFNCVTEIRDDNGYEWNGYLPDNRADDNLLDNVPAAIDHGTRQTVRALDSMAIATLFTHGRYVSDKWFSTAYDATANWWAILDGITDNLEPYEPIYVTMDYACQYARAMHTSKIVSAYSPANNEVTVNFSGHTDMPTRFYLFKDGEEFVMMDVPTFNGETTVNYTIPGPLDHILVKPHQASVVAGASLQFTASGYDAANNLLPNLRFAWSVAHGGGSISEENGLFTAGVTPGTYTDTVIASLNGKRGDATVTVTQPPDHFEIASITSPKFVGTPFWVTIRALDVANNLVPAYIGTVSLSASTGSVSPTSVGPFSGGVWSGQVQVNLDTAASNVTLRGVDGSISGTSNAFAVRLPVSKWINALDSDHGWTVNYPRTVGDVNGDGMADLVGFGLDGVYVATSTGNGFGAAAKWVSDFDQSHGWTVQDYVRTVGDVNGDGKADLVGFAPDGVWVSLSTGSSFPTPTKWVQAFDTAHGWNDNTQYVRTVGDVNGDGKAELVGFGLNGVWVSRLNLNGDGFAPPTKWVTAFNTAHGWNDNTQYVRTVGDVDGDGMADLVGFGLDGVYVSLSNGSGFGAIGKWMNDFDSCHGWTVNYHVRTVGDVNGDGKVDLVVFGLDGVYVSLSTGSSFAVPTKWVQAFDLAHGWNNTQYVRTVGDVTGDGKVDLVGFGQDGVYISTAQ